MAGLTDLRARKIKPGETLADGTIDGLMLIAGASPGKGRWLLRFTSPTTGKRREMGLGSYPVVGLADARREGFEAREMIARGEDPIDAKRQSKAVVRAEVRAAATVPTFGEVARSVIEDAQAESKNDKVKYQWGRNLGPAFCAPLLDRPIDEVKTLDIADVLRPVWRSKPEVARKLLPMIRRVFEKGRIILRDRHGREMMNPANWPDLKAMGFRSPQELTRGHHPSLPYDRLPAFMAALRERPAIAARLLEFIVLTGVRSGSARLARWEEFDLDGALWLVPVPNLKDSKTRREPFRVPLSARAVHIVRELAAVKMSPFVFPGSGQEPNSDMALTALLKRMDKDDEWKAEDGRRVVAHGFRATLRTWAEEQTGHPHAVIEETLGHSIGTKVMRAYRRTDVLDQRRALMDEWATFCGSSRV